MSEIHLDAIRHAVLDYAEGWYAGDADRVARALHEQLTKTAWLPNDDGSGRWSQFTAPSLVERVARTQAGTYTDAPRRAEISEVLVVGNCANLRLDMDQWTDLIHLIRSGEEWKIIHIAWTLPERH